MLDQAFVVMTDNWGTYPSLNHRYVWYYSESITLSQNVKRKLCDLGHIWHNETAQYKYTNLAHMGIDFCIKS